MHAIYTTLKTRIITLGVCLVALGFGATSVWAQSSDNDGYERFVTAKAAASTGSSDNDGYERLVTISPTTDINAIAEQPSRAALLSSYPNPFNPEATIRFDAREAQRVRLSVFNELGQRVAVLVDGQVAAGQHEARLTAYGLPSGTYFVRLETDAGVVTRSIVLMK